MLLHLHVKNLALIEEADVEFGPGLNILTGETGAGKSILLGSIQLILGGKTIRGTVREKAPYALVELLFQVENERAQKALLALDIHPEEGQVLLSKKIMEGRSVNKINGEISTVGQMKAAAACLLDIHGQHEHQSLLYPGKQLEILDAYGREEIFPAREKTETAYKAYKERQEALLALDMDPEKRNREMAFLEFEIKEIQDAALRPGEDEALEGQYRRLLNGKKIISALQEVHSLTGYEGQGSGEAVGAALRELSRVAEYDKALASLEGILKEADSLLNDFNRELSSYMEDMTFDQEAFYQTEQRLDLINTLKAKYGGTLEEIQKYCDQQAEKLETLCRYEEIFQKRQEELLKAEKLLEEESGRLSDIRRKYAKQLELTVVEGLRDLNFADVDFAISFSRKKAYGEDGYDHISYEISTNPGEPLKPLEKIVSGGELSRIMLALKAILADKDQIETLIFDEIDTGISGRTAQKVSEKMAVIGRHRQVICITHLPQIASMADVHFEIEKHVRDGETVTQIHPLDGEASIRELARLLGGAQITEAVFENAKEMKELAQVYKKS